MKMVDGVIYFASLSFQYIFRKTENKQIHCEVEALCIFVPNKGKQDKKNNKKVVEDENKLANNTTKKKMPGKKFKRKEISIPHSNFLQIILQLRNHKRECRDS